MRVGLWLEPEVIGVHSPVAATLPSEAFLQRHGRRVREHDRYSSICGTPLRGTT